MCPQINELPLPSLPFSSFLPCKIWSQNVCKHLSYTHIQCSYKGFVTCGMISMILSAGGDKESAYQVQNSKTRTCSGSASTAATTPSVAAASTLPATPWRSDAWYPPTPEPTTKTPSCQAWDGTADGYTTSPWSGSDARKCDPTWYGASSNKCSPSICTP